MNMKRINQRDFIESIQKLRKTESKKGEAFYDMAIKLANNGFKMEAYILILATWNFGHFRYVVKNFNIQKFKKKVEKVQYSIDKMKEETIRYINFDKYEKDIDKIYTNLAQIDGVKYTGASKVMHLMNPHLFVMWDNNIRGQKLKRHYQKLGIVKKGYWSSKRYGDDAKSYIHFLKDIQGLFGHLTYQDNTRTFAKAIDEYNYWNISRPIRKMQEAEK